MKSLIQTLIEDAGYNCRSYSGRSLYGREVLGVDCPSLANFISDFMATLLEHQRNTEVTEPEDYEVVTDAFRNMKVDTMGRDIIVYFTETDYGQEDRCHEECGC